MPILTLSVLVALIAWDLNRDIAQENQLLLVLPSVISTVIEWLNGLILTRLQVIKVSPAPCRWSQNSIVGLPRREMSFCLVYAIKKNAHHLPAGKLMPLPIPKRPWSHITEDFVTVLQVLKGNTIILVMVYRFWKGCWFVPFYSHCPASRRSVPERVLVLWLP